MHSKRLSLLILSLAAVGCGPTSFPEDVAAQQESIIGGTLATGDPAVVALAVRYGRRYQPYCTGTLIAPRTVLTAAHCINSYGTNVSYYALFGSTADTPTSAIPVTGQYKNPNYNQAEWDFGLLRLGSTVLDVPAIPINETPMGSSDIGRPIRHVGFGTTNPNSSVSGTKREVTYSVREIRAYTIESGAPGKQTCSGDSGGPALMTMPGNNKEVVVGVVSWGDDQCAAYGYDGRVDAAAPWIRQTMRTWEVPTCSTDGACVPGCTPVDQDCECKGDGVCGANCIDASLDPDCPKNCATNNICATEACGRPDADCIAEGNLCEVETQCRSRLCVTDPQNPTSYCTKACQTDADCPGIMECAAGNCRIRQRPERGLLESCEPRTDYCVESQCTGPTGGITRCVKTCVTTGDCPAGAVCEAGFDSSRYCRPADVNFKVITLPAVPSPASGPAAAGCSAVGGLAFWLLALPLMRRRRGVRANNEAHSVK